MLWQKLTISCHISPSLCQTSHHRTINSLHATKLLAFLTDNDVKSTVDGYFEERDSSDFYSVYELAGPVSVHLRTF